MTDHQNKLPTEQPPVFSSWSKWYAVVIGNLALIIAVLYFLTALYK